MIRRPPISTLFPSTTLFRDESVTGVQTCALPIRSEEHTSELLSHSHLVCRIIRSEEHTSELQSHSHLVCRLLLEKKKEHAQTAARQPRWRYQQLTDTCAPSSSDGSASLFSACPVPSFVR